MSDSPIADTSGPAGPKGDQGDQGIQGEKGDTGATGLGYVNPNLLINGSLRIWQRGPGPKVTASTDRYLPDMWRGSRNIQTLEQSLDVPTGEQFVWSVKVTREGGINTGIGCPIELPEVGYAGIYQVGETFTFSGWLKAPAGNTINFRAAFSDDSNNTNVVSTVPVTPIGTTTGDWQYITFSAALTLPPGANSNCLIPRIEVSSTGTIDTYFTGWKYEEGAVPTAFVDRPIAAELDLCRRYYRKYDTAQSVADLAYEMRTTPVEVAGGISPYQYDAEL